MIQHTHTHTPLSLEGHCVSYRHTTAPCVTCVIPPTRSRLSYLCHHVCTCTQTMYTQGDESLRSQTQTPHATLEVNQSGDMPHEPPPLSRLSSVEKLQQQQHGRKASTASMHRQLESNNRSSSCFESEESDGKLSFSAMMGVGAEVGGARGQQHHNALWSSGGVHVDRSSVGTSVASRDSLASPAVLSMAGESALFWEVSQFAECKEIIVQRTVKVIRGVVYHGESDTYSVG